MEFIDAMGARRSQYMLAADGVDTDAVVARIRDVAGKVPSAYNVQSARAFVLTGDDHRRLWGIVEDTLRARVSDPERFRTTRAKLAGFAAGAGTILFYEIESATQGLIEKYPTYADLFPKWAEQGNAMLQLACWTAIADMGLGANIQHYNPLIDDRVRGVFGIPEGYRLISQMVFGRVTEPAGPKRKLPGEEIVLLAHAKE